MVAFLSRNVLFTTRYGLAEARKADTAMLKKVATLAAVLLIAACQTANIPKEKPFATLALLSSQDQPIHLGDGSGNLSDFSRSERSGSPATSHKWTFDVNRKPDTVVVETIMYSLTTGCPTILAVNGNEIRDLQRGFTGIGAEDKTKVNVPPNLIRKGENTISIGERPCTRYSGLNDSLVRGLTVWLY